MIERPEEVPTRTPHTDTDLRVFLLLLSRFVIVMKWKRKREEGKEYGFSPRKKKKE
jgi:hypothetical protein